MTITNAKLVPYSLPLLSPWQDRAHLFTTRRGHLLILQDDCDHSGYGDCAPLPNHGTETEEDALTTLENMLPHLAGRSAQGILDDLPDATITPAARCAMETALLDLLAQQGNMALHRRLSPSSNPTVKVNAAIGALDDGSPQRAATAINQGYSILKLKVGISAPQQEMELLTLLCEDLPESVQLRLDANRAWDQATAQQFLTSIQGLPIESLEEPLAQPDVQKLAQLQDETDITLALDETLVGLKADDLPRLRSLRRIVLKPMILGGVIPALELGQRAQGLGIEAVVTTTIDSAAGVWAATHLAAALDTESRLCHGLGTGAWLQHDLGKGPDIRNGIITIQQIAGLGFRPYP